MTVPRLEQFRGCLIGQCLGDAIGCRVEGYSPEVCQNFVRSQVRPKKIRDRARFGLPFGQYTDDSQLARELLQSYAPCGEFDPTRLALRPTHPPPPPRPRTPPKLRRLWRIRPQRLRHPYC